MNPLDLQSMLIGALIAAVFGGFARWFFPAFMPLLVEKVKSKCVEITKGTHLSRVDLGEKHIELRAKIKENSVSNKKAATLLIRNLSVDLNRIVVVRSGDFAEICGQLFDHFDSIYRQIGLVGTRLAFYLPSDLNEVHIACEPPHELVNDSSDSMSILEKQLLVADKIVFYITTRNFESHKKRILRQLEDDGRYSSCLSKISFVPITGKLPKPVVVYKRDINQDVYGFSAKIHPKIDKEGDDYFYEEIPRNKDYFYLTKDQCMENLNELERRAV